MSLTIENLMDSAVSTQLELASIFTNLQLLLFRWIWGGVYKLIFKIWSVLISVIFLNLLPKKLKLKPRMNAEPTAVKRGKAC